MFFISGDCMVIFSIYILMLVKYKGYDKKKNDVILLYILLFYSLPLILSY